MQQVEECVRAVQKSHELLQCIETVLADTPLKPQISNSIP